MIKIEENMLQNQLEMQEVAFDHKELVYSGRIDRRDKKHPEFIFPASSLQFRFFGCKAVLILENRHNYWKNYVGAIVDGEQKSWLLNQEGQTEILLLDEEKEKEHEILFFKRQDSCHEIKLCALFLSKNGRILSAPLKPKRKLEVYGDSVSAGEVSEAVEYIGKADPEHQGEYSNSWYSYAWITARKLQAELHDIAQGGIALMDGTGWFYAPDSIGMETIWDQMHYHPAFGKRVSWDFSAYTPDVVIIAIGQNDSHPVDYMKADIAGEKAILWRKRYRKFLERLRKQYPNAYLICCTTLLIHDIAWDTSIEQVCQELEDRRIRYFPFQRVGKGTPGHLRISEAEEMAEELAIYIESLEIEGWR